MVSRNNTGVRPTQLTKCGKFGGFECFLQAIGTGKLSLYLSRYSDLCIGLFLSLCLKSYIRGG